MGVMNLLKANWTGSVGKTTGAIVRGKSIIKAKIDGRAPLNEQQITNVRRFEYLNRVASLVARELWDIFGSNKWKGLKHNYITKTWKEIMQDPFPELRNWDQILGLRPYYNLDTAEYDNNRRAATAIFNQDFSDPPPAFAVSALWYVNGNGACSKIAYWDTTDQYVVTRDLIGLFPPVTAVHVTMSIDREGVRSLWCGEARQATSV